VTDFLDEKRQEIAQRLKELKPLVEEHNCLEAAAVALQGVGGDIATCQSDEGSRWSTLAAASSSASGGGRYAPSAAPHPYA
jgi:hypothetical protein